MNRIPQIDVKTAMNAFIKAAQNKPVRTRNAAIVIAALVGAAYFFNSGSGDTVEKLMANAEKVVATNKAKPCAAEAAKISTLLLSDPKLTCKGPHVVMP